MRVNSPGVDTEVAWIKKSGKLCYCYKKHVATDEEGMVLGLVTTAANLNEITNLEHVLEHFGNNGRYTCKSRQRLSVAEEKRSFGRKETEEPYHEKSKEEPAVDSVGNQIQ